MPAIRGLPRLGAVVVAMLVVVVVAMVITRMLSESDEPGWSSNGITLNTSSWDPGDGYAMEALISSVVRIDPNGCVYLRREGVDVGVDVLWPAGYTAARQPDGTVTILNPDGVVVAATGHRLRAGGGHPPDAEVECRAEGTVGTPFMINDELPPLND